MILRFENITKKFGKTRALDAISLAINKNQICGLIGPDGAGKTTLLRILVTLIKPDQGQLFFHNEPYSFKQNVKLIRKKIGYMPQRFCLYPDLSIEQNLCFFGDLFNIPKQEQDKRKARLYSFSKLAPFKHRLSGNLSGGMKQKLALMCVLIHEPEMLILDEPTVGVDPVSRYEFWQILHELANNGTTIFVSTSYMNEAEECHNIALIYQGKLLKNGKPNDLIKEFPYKIYTIPSSEPYHIFEKLKKTKLSADCQLFGNAIHITDKALFGENQINLILTKNSISKDKLNLIDPGLEDLFLNLIN
ncbi:MAG: ABC transporter ATP-binding protein [Candidatus Margulisiibacteriota bacterium]|jgi:ABC-2 type transport system ATP-binding protein